MPPYLTHTQFIVCTIASFLIGACIGSYLNVVIYRLPLGMSTGKPKRSFCPSCKAQIPFYHNIPLISWLVLKGKCASCGSKISFRYWVVELLTALTFLAVFLHCVHPDGNRWLVLPYWILLSLFIAGTYIDLDHYILPDEITLGGAVVGVLASAIVPSFLVNDTWWMNLLHSLGGAAMGFGILYLVVELGKKLFGKKKMVFESPLPWEISQPEGAPEPAFKLEGDSTPWTDLFFRPTDRLIIHCPQAVIDGKTHSDVTLTIREEGVEVQPKESASSPATATAAAGAQAEGESANASPDASAPPQKLKLKLEDINLMSGACDSLIIPREAMGFGDVKFMALVGAFLGWKGVLFTIFAGSILGCLFAITLIVLGRREWAQKVPFGPYLALGATVYVFFGSPILQWYFSLGRHGVDG